MVGELDDAFGSKKQLSATNQKKANAPRPRTNALPDVEVTPSRGAVKNAVGGLADAGVGTGSIGRKTGTLTGNTNSKKGSPSLSKNQQKMQSQTMESTLSGNINLVRKNNKNSIKTVVNNKGVSYPEVTDIRTGQNMVFPDNVGSRIPKENRVSWYQNQSKANLNRINNTDILCKKDYIDEWYKRGYTTPKGGWKLYEIHHIKPREFGGSADFENMVPLLTNIHRKYVTPWWNSYGQKKIPGNG